MVAVGPLSPSAILRAMAEALSTHQQGDTTSDLSSSHEALALFVHACMTSLGFRLLGFDEDQPEEAQCHDIAPRLPVNWNASFNTYAFVYSHHDSSAGRFVIKVDRLGGKAEIRGIVQGSDTIARAEVAIKEYISNAALPLRITLDDEGVEDRTDLPQKLRAILVSNDQIATLASLVHAQIVQKLLPGGSGGHRGMHPTFGDPMFGGYGGQQGPEGPDFDPQVPPGARFDPVGPFGGPPSGRMGGRRGPGGGFGGGSGGFGGGFGGGDII